MKHQDVEHVIFTFKTTKLLCKVICCILFYFNFTFLFYFSNLQFATFSFNMFHQGQRSFSSDLLIMLSGPSKNLIIAGQHRAGSSKKWHVVIWEPFPFPARIQAVIHKPLRSSYTSENNNWVHSSKVQILACFALKHMHNTEQPFFF